MRRHTVREGECMASIAMRFGFESGEALHAHADNAALRERCPDPQLLVPGDVVVIPEQWRFADSAETGRWHHFETRAEPEALRLRLHVDLDEAPLRSVAYSISIDSGPWVDGTTSGDGVLEHAVSPAARDAEVLFFPEGGDVVVVPMWIELGRSGPVSHAPYAWQRLRALGYDPADDEPSIDALFDSLDALPEADSPPPAADPAGAEIGDDDEPGDLDWLLNEAWEEGLLDSPIDDDDAFDFALWEPEDGADTQRPAGRTAEERCLIAFQRDHGVPTSGALDEATRRKLEEVYDGV